MCACVINCLRKKNCQISIIDSKMIDFQLLPNHCKHYRLPRISNADLHEHRHHLPQNHRRPYAITRCRCRRKQNQRMRNTSLTVLENIWRDNLLTVCGSGGVGGASVEICMYVCVCVSAFGRVVEWMSSRGSVLFWIGVWCRETWRPDRRLLLLAS